ncbi:ABC transporter permease [Pseudonocardia sp. GCM10023141]|uniref:ABC transporter permease n=1 Tax=Pseudonocardia sp. GCM10023141 TaxID=3252653 RepID=UPI003618F317
MTTTVLEPPPSPAFRPLSRMRRLPLFSGAILFVFIVAGAFASLLAPHDPDQVDLASSLRPPVFAGGTWTFPLGTDDLGRDILSRLIGGARTSLLVGVAVVLISGLVGLAFAVLSGYLGGWVDSLLMRITDAALAFPVLLVALVIVGVFGPSAQNVVIILALTGWANYARVLRSEVLLLRSHDFVTMSVVMGARSWWVIRRHLVPNIVSTLLVLSTLQLGLAIVAEGSLSFLGLGVPPPAPSWGGMLSDGRQYLQDAWWIPLFPGLVLSLTVLAANLMGDWLRNQADPTKKR